MLTVPSSANSTTTLSLPLATLAVTTTDAVSTRATNLALPAPLSDQQTADNAQNNTSLPAAVVAEESATTVSANSFTASGLAANINTSGQSTSFLAQLYAQSADGDSDDTTPTAHFAPAPAYNTFVGYGYIKYKPSNAGIPAQRSPLPAPVTPSAPQATTQNVIALNVQTQPPVEVQTAANENAAVQQSPQPTTDTADTTITFHAPIVFTPPANQNTPADTTDTNPTPAPAQSAVTANAVSSNVQAYSQTQSRNQTNLTFSEPQIVVAG